MLMWARLAGGGDVIGKAKLDGKANRTDGRGVVTSWEELKCDENDTGEYVDYSELDDQRRRHGVVAMELDHQGGRRNIANAELEGREQERRTAELDAARTHQQRIARKAITGGFSSPQQSSTLVPYPQSCSQRSHAPLHSSLFLVNGS